MGACGRLWVSHRGVGGGGGGPLSGPGRRGAHPRGARAQRMWRPEHVCRRRQASAPRRLIFAVHMRPGLPWWRALYKGVGLPHVAHQGFHILHDRDLLPAYSCAHSVKVGGNGGIVLFCITR